MPDFQQRESIPIEKLFLERRRKNVNKKICDISSSKEVFEVLTLPIVSRILFCK